MVIMKNRKPMTIVALENGSQQSSSVPTDVSVRIYTKALARMKANGKRHSHIRAVSGPETGHGVTL